MLARSVVAILCVFVVSGTARANDVDPWSKPTVTAEELGLSEKEATRKGEEVVEAWDKCDYDFIDMRADYTLIQSDGEGGSVERELTLRLLEKTDYDEKGLKTSGDWTIVSFRSPSDVAGTALLVHANLIENDDTWIYLPTLKRVKRISSENQSGNFAGTEFAYEDIASQEYYKFSYKWVRAEKCGIESEPAHCDVVEQVPKYPRSGYSKQISWYDGCRQRKIDYYDHQGNLYKTQTFNDYRQYNGKNWRGHDNTMINHRNGRSTKLIIPKFVYRNEFTESQFKPNALRYIR